MYAVVAAAMSRGTAMPSRAAGSSSCRMRPGRRRRSRQLVERTCLGAVRVRRRHKPHATALVAMSPQSRQQGPHSAPPHERHDHVDADGRWNLGRELVLDRRLSTSVRQNGRVEQWSQRKLERSEFAVGTSHPYPLEHPRRWCESVGEVHIGRCELRQRIDQTPEHRRSVGRSDTLAQLTNEPVDERSNVSSEPVAGVCAPQPSYESTRSEVTDRE